MELNSAIGLALEETSGRASQTLNGDPLALDGSPDTLHVGAESLNLLTFVESERGENHTLHEFAVDPDAVKYQACRPTYKDRFVADDIVQFSLELGIGDDRYHEELDRDPDCVHNSEDGPDDLLSRARFRCRSRLVHNGSDELLVLCVSWLRPILVVVVGVDSLCVVRDEGGKRSSKVAAGEVSLKVSACIPAESRTQPVTLALSDIALLSKTALEQ